MLSYLTQRDPRRALARATEMIKLYLTVIALACSIHALEPKDQPLFFLDTPIFWVPVAKAHFQTGWVQ